MIIHALQVIKEELNSYLNSFSVNAVDDDDVKLGNISQLDLIPQGDADSIKNSVIITLVNIREEKTLKNAPNFRRNDTTMKAEYFNPPIHLNLYLLITANQNSYLNALIFLSRIASFFQEKTVFTHLNTLPVSNVPETEMMPSFKILMELYSPSFEELNHVWGTLGGKQLPGLMYLARVVEVSQRKPPTTGGLVEEIMLNVHGQNAIAP
ncbi:MAG: DUF4255 domain-containing protein [Saprospiraceae bacterium]|nr:DUF4255 domain-containing protein [Saprospiraceae bacterium]